MIKKITLWVAFCMALGCSASAQQINYTPDGKSFQADSERTFLVIFRPDSISTRAAGSNIALPGLLGSVASIGLNLIKTALTNQEEKYTASYSATLSEKSLLRLQNPKNSATAQLNVDSIGIYRLIVLPSGERDTAFRLILAPETEHFAGLFRLNVQSVWVQYAKAKVKRLGNHGKSLDLSVSFKLDALWQEAATTENSAAHGTIADSVHISRSTYTIKTATLGDASLLLPGIRPGRYVDLRTAGFKTSWFQLPPLTAMAFANEENHYTAVYFNVSATIKEANPYGVNSKKLADFLSSNSSDILSTIKSLLPQAPK
jgi:hypothetical protein